MAETVSERSHERSIADEVRGWSAGKFSGARGQPSDGGSNSWPESSAAPSTSSANSTVYTAQDLRQNGILDVERQLGTGGMGHVYMARDKEDGTVVAIKVGKEGTDRTGLESQLTEIVARSRLPADGHENLVKWFGHDDRALGCPIFMEVCTGGDLFDAAVDGYQQFNNVEILGLMQGIVSGLEYLHANGIVHCDVKTENVLLQPNGRGNFTPKIADLGGSMGTGDKRRGGGTYGYTAPEVIFAVNPAHGNQDVWSVGHMLMVLFTKRLRRAANMFLHSRLMTDADYGMKAEMKDLGREALFESYLTFKNMRNVTTLDTLLCEELFDEEMANLPEFFGGVRQILCLEATRRPSMLEIHHWLGLMIDVLSPQDHLAGTGETSTSGFSRQPVAASSVREESRSQPPARASASTVSPPRAAHLRPPPGFSVPPSEEDELHLLPRIGQGSFMGGSRHDALLVSPPGRPGASTGERKTAGGVAPPPGFESAALANEERLAPTAVHRPFSAELRYGETRSALSPAGVSASTGTLGKAARLAPPPGFCTSAPMNELHRTAATFQAASGANQVSAETMADPLGVGLPDATHPYGIAPASPSAATGCGIDQQQRAGSFETVFLHGSFQDEQATVHTPPCYGADPVYSNAAGYPIVDEQRFSPHHGADPAPAACGYGSPGEWRAPFHRGAPGWAGYGARGLGGWCAQEPAGRGWQGGNVPYEQHGHGGGGGGGGGGDVPPQFMPAKKSGKGKEHFHRLRGSNKHAGAERKTDAKKPRNRRRGGRRNRRPTPNQFAGEVATWVNPGYPPMGGGCAVPHAIMIDQSTPFCYAGGGFHSPQYFQGYSVGVAAC